MPSQNGNIYACNSSCHFPRTYISWAHSPLSTRKEGVCRGMKTTFSLSVTVPGC